MNGCENFTFEEWLIFLVLIAVVLFFMYPKSNGDFDDDYIKRKGQGKKKYWWEDQDKKS